jgi:hypothetical protein
MFFSVWKNTTLLFYFNLLMSLARQMDKRKTTSTTTFFGRFCVWENHVLCFTKEKIDIVQIRQPSSCHFCRHALVLTSTQQMKLTTNDPFHTLLYFPNTKRLPSSYYPMLSIVVESHLHLHSAIGNH